MLRTDLVSGGLADDGDPGADPVSFEIALYRAQERVTDVLAAEAYRPDVAPPTLRDFLNASMPEWLALAARAEMARQREYARSDHERGSHIEIWWRFVRSVARQAGCTNGVRFPR